MHVQFESLLVHHIRDFIQSNHDKIDSILITGDLADSGDPSDLNVAKEVLLGSPHPMATADTDSIEDVPFLMPVFGQRLVALMPGNNDRFANKAGHPGGKDFDQIFQSHWTKGAQGVEGFHLVDGSLVVLCADFTLRNKRVLAMHRWRRNGFVDPQTLRWLRKRTREYQRKGVAVLWATHFPPVFPRNFYADTGLREQERNLVDGHKLIQAAKSDDIRHIVCGHTHYSDCFNHSDVWLHCAGSSTCRNEERHTTIHILDISFDVGNIIELINTRYCWDGLQFTEWPYPSTGGPMICS